MPSATVAPPRVKPRLRGVSHQFAFYLWVVAGAVLFAWAPTGVPAFATGVHAATLAALLGISAFYHRPMWRPEVRVWLRRLDHSAIFLLIAGTYTPVCLLALPDGSGRVLLTVAWAGAAAGILKSMLWPHAPRWVTVGLYLAFSWAIVAEWRAVATGLGTWGIVLVATGGLLYSGGALVYGKRWPDPRPRTFGYHEIFHACVVLAAGCHAVAVARLVHGFV